MRAAAIAKRFLLANVRRKSPLAYRTVAASFSIRLRCCGSIRGRLHNSDHPLGGKAERDTKNNNCQTNLHSILITRQRTWRYATASLNFRDRQRYRPADFSSWFSPGQPASTMSLIFASIRSRSGRHALRSLPWFSKRRLDPSG